MTASTLKRILAPAEEMQLVGWLFLRLLALIYCAAFVSLAGQIDGLAGPEGILPLERSMAEVAANLDRPSSWLWLPSLFWLTGASGVMLEAVAYLGALLSLLLFFGRWERPLLITLFVFYLSLYHAGQVFTNFQWDTLLLESGFLAIFLPGGANRLLILLFEWLLFRLRFMSGFFKLFSGDPSWSGLTALNHYFETQPLPHIGAWYAQQLPEWVLRSGTGLTLFSELILPFFIFLPRPFRLTAAIITLLIQVLIIATSNHNFINLLTIALCLFLLDDRLLGRLLPRGLGKLMSAKTITGVVVKTALTGLAALLILPASLIGFSNRLVQTPLPDPLLSIYQGVRRFGIGNIYHVYPTMQTQRQELTIQGSRDGQNWSTYHFHYKPGDLDPRPPFNVPHHPRLDWMIWFVPTQQPVQMAWFGEFMRKLHEGSAPVLGLLRDTPFPDRPPQYLRVLVYDYRFTDAEQRRETGNWWRADYLGIFPRTTPRRP